MRGTLKTPRKERGKGKGTQANAKRKEVRSRKASLTCYRKKKKKKKGIRKTLCPRKEGFRPLYICGEEEILGVPIYQRGERISFDASLLRQGQPTIERGGTEATPLGPSERGESNARRIENFVKKGKTSSREVGRIIALPERQLASIRSTPRPSKSFPPIWEGER